MKTASFVGVNLPQTPVHLVQILNSIFQWGDFNPGTLTFNPNSMKISNWTTNLANQSHNDLDWPGFTRFVANTYQSQITRFWGKILNSSYCLCKKFDISQLCGQLWKMFHRSQKILQASTEACCTRIWASWRRPRPSQSPPMAAADRSRPTAGHGSGPSDCAPVVRAQ